MKKLGKTILILILIVFLLFLGLFIIRAKQSNELKSGLLREDSNGIIQQVVWGGNDLSINVNGPQTALRIPISSVVPETLTWKNFKFRLNLYDENGEKLDYVFLGEKGIPSGVSHSSVVNLIFKDSILGMKEFKMPVGAISRINEDTFQVELEDFDGYADMAGDDIRYKIFGKGKIDSVYLEIFHGNNVKLEFAIVDDEVIIEDYCEGTECKDLYPWGIEDLYGNYKLVSFNYETINIPATLTISENLIGAKFCNNMGSDDYSIDGKYIHVNNMSQTEMLCESEKLMELEDKFDLSNAEISLVERSLRFTTSNGDIYDFFKSEKEPELSEIETLKQSFTGDIIDGTNLGIVEITQDDTLYFNDKFGFAVILGKEWNGGKIEAKTHNEQFGEKAISWSIAFTKKGFDYESYKLSIDKNERYDSMKKHDEFWTEEDFEKSTKGRNNKYYFLGGIGGFISPSMDTSEELDTNLFPDGFIFYDVE